MSHLAAFLAGVVATLTAATVAARRRRAEVPRPVDHAARATVQPRVRVTIDGTEIGPYPYHVGDATEQLSGGRWS